jgi:hypothetical protein
MCELIPHVFFHTGMCPYDVYLFALVHQVHTTDIHTPISSRASNRKIQLEDLPRPPSPPQVQDTARAEHVTFQNIVEAKRRRIQNLLQIAHMQAEEQWDSNVKWIMHAGKRKASSSMNDLEKWHTNFQRVQARRMEQDISVALNRMGDAEYLDNNALHLILRKIYDLVLQTIQDKEARDTLDQNRVVHHFDANKLLSVSRAKTKFSHFLSHHNLQQEEDHVGTGQSSGGDVDVMAPPAPVVLGESREPVAPVMGGEDAGNKDGSDEISVQNPLNQIHASIGTFRKVESSMCAACVACACAQMSPRAHTVGLNVSMGRRCLAHVVLLNAFSPFPCACC